MGDWPTELVVLHQGNFEEIVNEYKHVIIDCWAPWCGPCLALEPTIKEISKEYVGKVLFAKMNTDENLEIARRLGIMSLPTILYFRNGECEDRITGGIQKHTLKERVDELVHSG